MGRGRNEEKPKIRRTLARDPDLAASTGSGGEDGESKREGRGAQGVLCAVSMYSVIVTSRGNRFSDCATSLVSARAVEEGPGHARTKRKGVECM